MIQIDPGSMNRQYDTHQNNTVVSAQSKVPMATGSEYGELFAKAAMARVCEAMSSPLKSFCQLACLGLIQTLVSACQSEDLSDEQQVLIFRDPGMNGVASPKTSSGSQYDFSMMLPGSQRFEAIILKRESGSTKSERSQLFETQSSYCIHRFPRSLVCRVRESLKRPRVFPSRRLLEWND